MAAFLMYRIVGNYWALRPNTEILIYREGCSFKSYNKVSKLPKVLVRLWYSFLSLINNPKVPSLVFILEIIPCMLLTAFSKSAMVLSIGAALRLAEKVSRLPKVWVICSLLLAKLPVM